MAAGLVIDEATTDVVDAVDVAAMLAAPDVQLVAFIDAAAVRASLDAPTQWGGDRS